MKTSAKKILMFVVKLSISLIFVAWLIYQTNWQEVWLNLKDVSFLMILLYIIVLLIGMAISAYKWQILAKYKGFENRFSKYFALYLTGTFINNFFPSFIGGDTYKAYQIGKSEKRYLAATSTVIVDRITGLIGALFLAVIFALLNWQAISRFEKLVYFEYIVAAFLLAVLFLLAASRINFVSKSINLFPEKIKKVLNDFLHYKDPGILVKTFLFSVLFSLIGLGILNYILFLGMGIKISLLDFFSVIFLISFVSAIPVSINNIGIKEWAYVTFFAFFGISSGAVVAVAILSRFLQMIVSFFALPFYLRNKKG